MKVSIVIPCLNEENYILNTINSFLNQSYENDFEIIVADGLSTDKTRKIISENFKENQKVILIDNKERTTPYALNHGVSQARGKYILIAGAHAKYPQNLLTILSEFLDQEKDIDVAGLQLLTCPANNSLQSLGIADALNSPFAVGNSYFRTGLTETRLVDTVAFGMYRKSIFKRFGLFDTDLTRNQDDEFNARLKRNNIKIALLPGEKIEYFARDEFSKLFKMFYQYGLFKPLVNIKTKSIVSIRQLIPTIFVLSLFACILVSFLSLLPLSLLLSLYLNFLFLYAFRSYKGSKIRVLFGMYSILLIHLAYGVGFTKGCLIGLANKDKKLQINR